MAGHIQDRWYKTEQGTDGRTRRVKTDRHGTGMRYRARYVGPDGTEKSRSFPDRQKRLADQWLAHIEADMSRGAYIDPAAGRTTFKQYAERWIAAQTTDVSTRTTTETRLRLHAFPYLGSRPLASFRPSHIRSWVRQLEDAGLASSYRRSIFANVSAVLTAAVDDTLIPRNPCRASSVAAPKPSGERVKPWTAQQVFAVRDALPPRYQSVVDLGAGCGLRQGEIFGLPLDAVGFLTGWLHVGLQIKVVKGRAYFGLPKGDKVRDVPLPEQVGAALAQHIERYPPVEITLPWMKPDGPPVTRRLVFSGPQGNHVYRSNFNIAPWKPALAAAGLISRPDDGSPLPSAREHGMHALRHFYASVLLDAGENIKALSNYLGHTDPGFTLRVYTHLMPSSENRTRKAVNHLYERPTESGDGPETAQAA
ncbi:site-specific integrase [Streptomyces sp. ISL-98]|uniref:site-specific integrase n=1 Tax=Streptomyces sp. ISL-98 TaxID=2819192 RepID=UPI001BE5F76D|nr:site-specific integrase [Streptomyces sp. ISL-98]MBT2509654.1 site-specific integrase [Streptomyces sp. ISL-98]